jgi:hypothetical protein
MRMLVAEAGVVAARAGMGMGMDVVDAVGVTVAVKVNPLFGQAIEQMAAEANQHQPDAEVMVWPMPQTAPWRTMRPTELSRAARLLTAARWSASKACCIPIRKPRNSIDSIAVSSPGSVLSYSAARR